MAQFIKPDQLIDILSRELQKLLGPFEGSLKPKGRLHSECVLGKPGKGKNLNRVLSSLDFTSSYNAITSYYGGARQEISGEVTIVNYCDLSGVLVVTTNLTVKKI